MMTRTTLSDGRRTRPRFAAPAPTRPKFLIATFEQPKNHSTPSKQTTNPNPNRNKTRLLRPPRRIADSPWRFAAPEISRPRPLFGLIPIAQLHPRKPSGLSRSLGLTPFAQLHPRKPSGLSQSLGLTPFAQPHPRKPLVSGVLQRNDGALDSLPFALLHPRNKQSARQRAAGESKTPAGCQRYKNPTLIGTPRLEIAATVRKTNEIQISNRYKTTVLQLPPQIDANRRMANAASSPPLEILIANLELEFKLTHTKLSPLRISNRKYSTIFYSDFVTQRGEIRKAHDENGGVVATAIRTGFCLGFSRAVGHKLRIASCGRASLCGEAEEGQAEREQRDRAGFGRVDRVSAHRCEDGVARTIGQSPVVAVGHEAGAIPKFAGERAVIENRKAVAYGIETTFKGDLKQRAWIEGEKSGDIEHAIRGRTLYDFVEHAGGSLLVVSVHRESARNAARSGRHHSFHQHVAIDCASAAELAAFDIHDGAAGCGERAIHDRAAAGLRVVGAGGENAGIGNRNPAGCGEASAVIESPGDVEPPLVGNAPCVLESRIIDCSRIVDCAGVDPTVVGECTGVVDHAGVAASEDVVIGAFVVERASVGEPRGDGAAVIQGAGIGEYR